MGDLLSPITTSGLGVMQGGANIPGMAQGGTVPGYPGEERLAVLHGGELVLPHYGLLDFLMGLEEE